MSQLTSMLSPVPVIKQLRQFCEVESMILEKKRLSNGSYTEFLLSVQRFIKIDDEKLFKRVYWSTGAGARNLKNMLESVKKYKIMKY